MTTTSQLRVPATCVCCALVRAADPSPRAYSAFGLSIDKLLDAIGPPAVDQEASW
jgi:hypothetical protein